MTLADYLKSEGRTGRWLAQRLGCSEQHISGIRKNNAKPSRILAKAIERETAGAVPASQWGETLTAGDGMEEQS